MKILIRRFLEEQSFALGVLGAIAMIAGELTLGDGLQATDLPAILALLGVGTAARKRP
jgi:hypothetical protein